MSRIESGESEPGIDTVNKIAKALDKKVKIDIVS
ncbi:MAG: helix-turn-helix domain-containing protein [Bacillota bacterium]